MRHMGLLAMSSQLPTIMADVAEDARTVMETCHRCDGSGKIPMTAMSLMKPRNGDVENDVTAKLEQERNCPMCKGTGEIRRAGDPHARDLVFESMKLIRQRGPLVAIAQNIGVDGMDMRMESLLKLTRAITMERPMNDPSPSSDTNQVIWTLFNAENTSWFNLPLDKEACLRRIKLSAATVTVGLRQTRRNIKASRKTSKIE